MGSTFCCPRKGSGASWEGVTLDPGNRRRQTAGAQRLRANTPLRLRLAYQPPLAWEALLSFLAGRAIPGVEQVEGGVYRRTVALGDRTGWIAVSPGGEGALLAEVSAGLANARVPLLARLRHLFGLDACPAEIDGHLSRDPLLRRRIVGGRGRPGLRGLRVPGAFDGFEAAVRAVLGQQVTDKGATTIAGRMAARLGSPLVTSFPGLTHLFPPAPVLAGAGTGTVAKLGMPGARAAAVIALARAVDGGLLLAPGVPVESTLERLRALPGIGDWTAQYVAMRALGWPDAFPAGDLGVLQALGLSRPAEARARAERWRPWRAYATLHLWTHGASP
jgi:AraC family transcriptional regulator of adaptative response / DNA-3-methyladenine glycosylase II